MPDTITRTGKIFTAGEYPDKDFALSEAELEAAVNEFEPVPIEIDHTKNLPYLDGQMGRLEKIWKVGKDLFGQVSLPKWLDDLLPKRSVSCSWNRSAKRLESLSLTPQPYIADAVLFSDGDNAKMNLQEQIQALTLENEALRIKAVKLEIRALRAETDREALRGLNMKLQRSADFNAAPTTTLVETCYPKLFGKS